MTSSKYILNVPIEVIDYSNQHLSPTQIASQIRTVFLDVHLHLCNVIAAKRFEGYLRNFSPIDRIEISREIVVFEYCRTLVEEFGIPIRSIFLAMRLVFSKNLRLRGQSKSLSSMRRFECYLYKFKINKMPLRRSEL